MKTILHLVRVDYYNALPPGKPYLSQGFEREGFIHCTAGKEVLLRVANAIYREMPGDFVVLVVDETQVTAPVRYEAPVHNSRGPDTILFPHIYGPIDREAIVDVVPVRRRPDGQFVGFERPLGE